MIFIFFLHVSISLVSVFSCLLLCLPKWVFVFGFVGFGSGFCTVDWDLRVLFYVLGHFFSFLFFKFLFIFYTYLFRIFDFGVLVWLVDLLINYFLFILLWAWLLIWLFVFCSYACLFNEISFLGTCILYVCAESFYGYVLMIHIIFNLISY